jgi:hypothetical protein
LARAGALAAVVTATRSKAVHRSEVREQNHRKIPVVVVRPALVGVVEDVGWVTTTLPARSVAAWATTEIGVEPNGAVPRYNGGAARVDLH